MKTTNNKTGNNKFEDVMAKRTDEQLQDVINSAVGDYQPEAIEAAKQEIKKRESIRDKFSNYSDEQIVEITKSVKDFSKRFL